jgi:hypothetical protein
MHGSPFQQSIEKSPLQFYSIFDPPEFIVQCIGILVDLMPIYCFVQMKFNCTAVAHTTWITETERRDYSDSDRAAA